MPAPVQQQVTDQLDPLYHQMRAAYQGNTLRWQAVTTALRDAMVDHAVRSSPFYTKIAAGTMFEDLPVVTKRDLREHHEDMVAGNVPQERRLLQRTSGSTAEPVVFYRDRNALLVDAASDRFMRWLHGIPFDATMVAISAVGRAEPFSLRDRLSRRWRAALSGEPRRDPWIYAVTMTETGPAEVPGQLETWSRFERYFIVGNASSVDWFADQIERRGLELRKSPLAVGTNADQLTELGRRRIERVFGSPVHTRYGTTEMRWLAPSEPGSVSRYLFNPLRAYVEILDEVGRPVPAGTHGRLVLTDLHNFAMPLIRYDIGDVAVRSPDGWIGGFPIIEEILGREPDVLTLPSGRIIASGTVGNHLFIHHDFTPWIRFYQCAQTGPNALELRVIWRDRPDETVRSRLHDAMTALGDPDSSVTVRDVHELSHLPSGKVWIVRREYS